MARAAAMARVVTGLSFFFLISLVMELGLRVRVLSLAPGDPRRARRMSGLVRRWGLAAAWMLRAIAGVRLSVDGRAPEQGRYLIVANHQSSLDVPLLIALFRRQNLRFVAIDWLARGKLAVSAALRAEGFATVSQKAVGPDLAALMRFGAQLERQKASAVLFPEGRRTEDGELQPMHFAGVEAVRRTSRLPVIPVVLDGLWRARTMREYLVLPGSELRIHIGAPISTERFDEDPRGAYAGLEAYMRETLRRLRGRA